MGIDVRFSEERQTWNLFVNGEWYAENADYEVIDDMARNMRLCEIESEVDYE